MSTLKQFKQVRSSVPPEVQTELHSLLLHDLDAAVEKMISIGESKGIAFTVEEVLFYLKILYEEGMLDAVKIDDLELASIDQDPSFHNEPKAKMRAARKQICNSSTRQLARAVNLFARLNRLKKAVETNSTASKLRGSRAYVVFPI